MSFSLIKLGHYFWGTVVNPTKTFKAIATEGSLLYPMVAMIIFGILYSTLSFLLYLQEHQPSLPILISVPPEKFYLMEAVYLTPITLQLWILFSALCHLLAGHKRGSFSSALTVLGFANAVPNILMFWLPDLISTVLFGRIFTIPMSIYGIAWFSWVIYLSGVGLKITHHISTLHGGIMSLIAFMIHFSIGFFFIR